jgi:Fur family transcriptional regulator, ferric uptake regulator
MPVRKLLKEHDLRLTSPREEVLRLFLSRSFALSHSDIESEVSATIDRVTVYRTLKTFVDKGILHKVLDDTGAAKYALCSTHCSTHDHKHEHVHFKCLACGNTQCVEDVQVPSVSLPEGFSFKEANLLIQGVCRSCNLIQK